MSGSPAPGRRSIRNHRVERAARSILLGRIVEHERDKLTARLIAFVGVVLIADYDMLVVQHTGRNGDVWRCARRGKLRVRCIRRNMRCVVHRQKIGLPVGKCKQCLDRMACLRRSEAASASRRQAARWLAFTRWQHAPAPRSISGRRIGVGPGAPRPSMLFDAGVIAGVARWRRAGSVHLR